MERAHRRLVPVSRRVGLLAILGLLFAFSALAAVFLLQSHKKSQKLTTNAPTSVTYGDAPFAVTADASSGLGVEVSVKDGPCQIQDGLVTTTGAGLCEMRLLQAGDKNYRS